MPPELKQTLLKLMLSNTGITLVILTTLLSVLIIYKSFTELKIENNFIIKRFINLVLSNYIFHS